MGGRARKKRGGRRCTPWRLGPRPRCWPGPWAPLAQTASRPAARQEGRCVCVGGGVAAATVRQPPSALPPAHRQRVTRLLAPLSHTHTTHRLYDSPWTSKPRTGCRWAGAATCCRREGRGKGISDPAAHRGACQPHGSLAAPPAALPGITGSARDRGKNKEQPPPDLPPDQQVDLQHEVAALHGGLRAEEGTRQAWGSIEAEEQPTYRFGRMPDATTTTKPHTQARTVVAHPGTRAGTTPLTTSVPRWNTRMRSAISSGTDSRSPGLSAQ